jgi:CRISPR/Cas system-associated exonuclease Cas4 (RecB family)
MPAAFLGQEKSVDGFTFKVDEEMIADVEMYLNFLSGMMLAGGKLHSEVKVPIGHITGESGATGTSDAIIIDGDEMIVIDLKTGRRVEVEAENNDQLLLYAAGAIAKFYGGGNHPRRIRMVICQTGMKKVSEWLITYEELLSHAERIKAAAAICMAEETPPGNPGDKQCKYCRAKSVCTALEATVRADFENVTKPADMDGYRLAKLFNK